MPRSSHWHRDPNSPFHLLQHELGRLLEQYLPTSRFGGPEAPPTDIDPAAWTPPVDVYETPEELLIVAELPGVDPASIDLAVTGNVLTLRGVKAPGDLPEPLLQVRERPFGAFHRQITLPNEVDFEKAEADAHHGVLKVRLPKRTAAKARTIPIRPG
jgi:HSP20 family protein